MLQIIMFCVFLQTHQRSASSSEANMENVVAVAAGTEQCRQHFVEMQALIKKMAGPQHDAMTALD